ncbi:MAG TPA: hypothetical protein VJ723_07910 [Candidatus Angelobacter sp.]|nr:hypothetical protein [Candidatus Angelobacter sp.]
MTKTATSDAQPKLEDFYGDIFFEIMIGMTKAETVEAEYAKFRETARQWTKEQLRRIAGLAGQYYARHANPPPPKEKVPALKMRAIQWALEQWENEKAK